ncbi:MAG: hypothetical protein ACI9B9_000522 [Halioglobus sp.]|jgi:hypothetical protein
MCKFFSYFLSMSLFVAALHVSAAVPLVLSDATLEGTETIVTAVGNIEIEHNYPTDSSSAVLFDLMDIQRASQAYMWATPLIGFASWKNEQAKSYDADKFGDFVIFRSLNEKRGIVTANLTTPYIIGFMNLEKAPILIDYPAGNTIGGVLDVWQRPIGSFGMAGSDKGKGGKYLVVGPKDDPLKYSKQEVIVIQSPSNNIFLGLRIIDRDPLFTAKFESSLKISYLGDKPVASRFIKGLDRAWSATPPRGLAYWRLLAEIINEEPVRDVDKIMMAMLAPLGVEKGKPFNPDNRQTQILNEGAVLGELFTRNIQVNPRYSQPYWKETSWYKSFDFGTSQQTDVTLQLDERATWFYEAVTSSEGMVNPKVGSGQVYMTTKRDNNGQLLRADQTYRLHVPANVPVKQFWSLTLYSEQTRRPYDNGGTDISSVSLDSRMKQLQFNRDGSIDLYVGVKPPKGLENNFLKTVGEDGWFPYFRLYAPTEPFFDKSFSLPDLEIQ